jgi:hypothetical protein
MSGGPDSARLFQVREPRRRFLGPFLLVIALHALVIGESIRTYGRHAEPAKQPVRVVLKLPIRKVAVNEAPGGSATRPPRPPRRKTVRRKVVAPQVIPPPLPEQPPPPPVEEPPALAEAEEAGDADDGDLDAPPGDGAGGGGWGTGSGPGTGPGRGSVKSKARKAWLTHTDWKCSRPGYDEMGHIVVRIRVEVLPDGKPGKIMVVKAGPESFTRRAIDCARDETYLPALDPEGTPIPGEAEFSIGFLN